MQLPVNRLCPAIALLTAIAGASPLAAAPARKSAKAPVRKPAVKKSVSRTPSRKAAPAPLKKGISTPAAEFARLRIDPAEVILADGRAHQQLLVTGIAKDGQETDITDRVTFGSQSAKIAAVTGGKVRPVGDGETKVSARLGKLTATVPVTVVGAEEPSPISFVNDVMPILSKAGCNGSSCHGSPAGKGGLKLSLFGYEPDLDHPALTGGENPRIDPKDPAKSLALQKPLGIVPHAGGVRFKADSPDYRTLLAWIQQGAKGIGELEARVQGITVTPAERWLARKGTTQRLLVTAQMSDGTTLDVTEQAMFDSNDDSVADVSDQGTVSSKAPGETAIMVRHLGQVAVARVAVLTDRALPKAAHWPARRNFIDEVVFNKLQRLKVLPSQTASDEEFVRRVYLDVCGIIPTPEEVRTFLADTAPDKRAKLIDQLLDRPDYADVWTLKWSDMLRNNPKFTGPGVLVFHEWIREQMAKNVPADQFVRALLTATGRNGDEVLGSKKQAKKGGPSPAMEFPLNPATNFYMVTQNPLDTTSAASQVFLGVRLECARCHNHPFEKWTQNDYYGLAANFSGVRILRSGRQGPGAVVAPEPAPEPVVVKGRKRKQARRVRGVAIVRHPKTNEVMEPRFLDGTLPQGTGPDRREALAAWITAPENPFFARNIANRIWAHFLGRGVVEPVDDMRVTNPPSNPELLDALAKELVTHKFDMKHLARTILNSQVYQLSSSQNEFNREDTTNYARAYPRRLSAEQLYDSISQATGQFVLADQRRNRRRGANQVNLQTIRKGYVETDVTRAVKVPTPAAPGALGQFLDAFGRPRREIVCECERTVDGNIGQALLLLNGDLVNNKIAARGGRLEKLLAEGKSDAELIEEIFLAGVSRRPTPQDQSDAQALLKEAASREAGAQDLMWSLLNSQEFLFNH